MHIWLVLTKISIRTKNNDIIKPRGTKDCRFKNMRLPAREILSKMLILNQK